MFEEEKKNYYEILDIPPDASQSDIRQAYFRTKAAYSRDSAATYSLFDSVETKSMLERIEEAYLVLSNSERRKEYDKTHGFLQANDGQSPVQRRQSNNANTTARNTFSFSNKSEDSDKTKNDPAHQAANAIFGSEHAHSDMGNPNAHKRPPANPGDGEHATRSDMSDYAVPRTLASSSAAGPPIEDYVSPARGDRLGTVRRVDLLKPYEKNEEIEASILSETEFRGSFLKRIREYRSITIEELSDFTKISRTYLNCIEAEEFDSLPAPAYLRGFITQIAKAIKIPNDKAANGYMSYYRSVVGNTK